MLKAKGKTLDTVERLNRQKLKVAGRVREGDMEDRALVGISIHCKMRGKFKLCLVGQERKRACHKSKP